MRLIYYKKFTFLNLKPGLSLVEFSVLDLNFLLKPVLSVVFSFLNLDDLLLSVLFLILLSSFFFFSFSSFPSLNKRLILISRSSSFSSSCFKANSTESSD